MYYPTHAHTTPHTHTTTTPHAHTTPHTHTLPPPPTPHSLQQLSNLNLLEPIHCIELVQDHSTKVTTNLLVGLGNGKLIIVSVKDPPQ